MIWQNKQQQKHTKNLFIISKQEHDIRGINLLAAKNTKGENFCINYST